MKGHYLPTCFTGGFTYTCEVLRAGTSRIHPTFSILCSEIAFKMWQCYLPSNCSQQPLEI